MCTVLVAPESEPARRQHSRPAADDSQVHTPKSSARFAHESEDYGRRPLHHNLSRSKVLGVLRDCEVRNEAEVNYNSNSPAFCTLY